MGPVGAARPLSLLSARWVPGGPEPRAPARRPAVIRKVSLHSKQVPERGTDLSGAKQPWIKIP